ncbi:MAG: serine/threonine-protein kinase [Caldimonas sp.]
MTIPDRQTWKRLSPLLDELWELTPAARELRLASLRTSEPGLVAELRRLLADAGRAEAAQFLSGVAASPQADGPPPTLAGTRLGAYVLEASLGAGGMGAVWQARRADGRFEALAAVKLLHLSLIGAAGARRFEREGAILARLSHPHIARLLDAGVSPTGQPYLVLELVDGQRIDRYCDARHAGIKARIALFRSVLGAVAHAHRHLIIHRDLKPGNILVSAEGEVKLLDFGIAKLLQGQDDEAVTDLTGGLRGVLTPDYAAPEQLRGQAITTATDIYALGILLHQLLTGRHPTAPPNATAADLVRTTLDVDPPALSAAVAGAMAATPPLSPAALAAARGLSLARLQRQLRGDLEIITAKALRKAPGERYATVDAFDEDLRRWAGGEPIAARAPSLGYRTARFVARHRVAVAGSALALAAILAGLVGTFTQALRAEDQAAQAQVERDNALRDLAFAGAANNLVSFLVSQGNATPLTAAQLLARSEQLADRQFAEDPLSRGRLQLMIGTEYGNVQEYEKSKAVLLRAQASARSASSPELLSNTDCMLAALYGDQNEPKRALALFGEAIDRLRAQPVPDSSALAACLQMRADLHAQSGRSQAMLDDGLAALAALGRPMPHQRVIANSIGMVIAEAYGRLGKTALAIAAYEHSLAELAGMGRQQTARTVVRYNNFSRMLFAAGQPLRAEEMAARGLAISRALGSATDSGLDAIVEANRAHALVELGRFDEAKVLTEHALASAEARKDTRWAGIFALYGAPAWCETGDLARCRALLAIARERLAATLPPSHSMFAALELAAARLSLREQQPEAAHDRLQRAIALFEAAPNKSPLRIEAHALLAREEARRGNADEAARHAALAVAQAREAAEGLAASEWLGTALVAQGLAERAQGRGERARESLGVAVEQLRRSAGDEAPVTREALALLNPP